MADRDDRVTAVLMQRMFDALSAGNSVNVLIAGKQEDFLIKDARSSQGLLELQISEDKVWHLRDSALLGVRVMKPLDFSDLDIGGSQILG